MYFFFTQLLVPLKRSIRIVLMKSKVRVSLGLMVFFVAAVIILPGCAASKKDTYYQKKVKAQSHIDASKLGRNKYFFSTQYQKKLNKFKKK